MQTTNSASGTLQVFNSKFTVYTTTVAPGTMCENRKKNNSNDNIDEYIENLFFILTLHSTENNTQGISKSSNKLVSGFLGT